jgi:hypothetical protein
MDPVTAAVLTTELEAAPGVLARGREVARRYDEGLRRPRAPPPPRRRVRRGGRPVTGPWHTATHLALRARLRAGDPSSKPPTVPDASTTRLSQSVDRRTGSLQLGLPLPRRSRERLLRTGRARRMTARTPIAAPLAARGACRRDRHASLTATARLALRARLRALSDWQASPSEPLPTVHHVKSTRVHRTGAGPLRDRGFGLRDSPLRYSLVLLQPVRLAFPKWPIRGSERIPQNVSLSSGRPVTWYPNAVSRF